MTNSRRMVNRFTLRGYGFTDTHVNRSQAPRCHASVPTRPLATPITRGGAYRRSLNLTVIIAATHFVLLDGPISPVS